jgi:hypothetical protein
VINSIIAGISTALYDAFGERYEIFDDEIKQDLNEPCFFIACLNPTHKQFLGKRYFRTNNFCIQYFPESNAKQHECLEVAESMTECLEIVNVDGVPLRGTKMQYEVSGGVLNFFVNYDYFAYKTEEETPMEDMSITQKAE